MPRSLTTEEVASRIQKNFKQNVVLIGDYINKTSPITLRCNDCGYEWITRASSAISNGVHICAGCGKDTPGSKRVVHCDGCGEEIVRYERAIKKSKTGMMFCSRECGNRYKNMMRKRSGEWDNSLSYRKRAFDAYEHVCKVCGWSEDERILEVHHIDEDRSNNDVENLCILCPTCHRKITLGYYVLTDSFHLLPNTLCEKYIEDVV